MIEWVAFGMSKGYIRLNENTPAEEVPAPKTAKRKYERRKVKKLETLNGPYLNAHQQKWYVRTPDEVKGPFKNEHGDKVSYNIWLRKQEVGE